MPGPVRVRHGACDKKSKPPARPVSCGRPGPCEAPARTGPALAEKGAILGPALAEDGAVTGPALAEPGGGGGGGCARSRKGRPLCGRPLKEHPLN